MIAAAQQTPTHAELAAARKERLARIATAANAHQAKLDEVQRQKDREIQMEKFKLAMDNMPRKPIIPPIPAPTVVLPVVIPSQQPHILTIQGCVAEHFGITRVELVSQRRTAGIALPRQVAMYLVKDLTRYSLQQIGHKFGWRDHTTVIHAVNKMRAEVLNGTELGGKILRIRRELLA